MEREDDADGRTAGEIELWKKLIVIGFSGGDQKWESDMLWYSDSGFRWKPREGNERVE